MSLVSKDVKFHDWWAYQVPVYNACRVHIFETTLNMLDLRRWATLWHLYAQVSDRENIEWIAFPMVLTSKGDANQCPKVPLQNTWWYMCSEETEVDSDITYKSSKGDMNTSWRPIICEFTRQARYMPGVASSRSHVVCALAISTRDTFVYSGREYWMASWFS